MDQKFIGYNDLVSGKLLLRLMFQKNKILTNVLKFSSLIILIEFNVYFGTKHIINILFHYLHSILNYDSKSKGNIKFRLNKQPNK